jgi:predicted xylose isomerase-like sugar epimerase
MEDDGRQLCQINQFVDIKEIQYSLSIKNGTHYVLDESREATLKKLFDEHRINISGRRRQSGKSQTTQLIDNGFEAPSFQRFMNQAFHYARRKINKKLSF